MVSGRWVGTSVVGGSVAGAFNKTPEIEISVKYILYMQFTVASALLRNSVSIEVWLAATAFVKYCSLKNLFPAINYKEQLLYFGSQSFLMSL